jgi:hypothetical protein
LLDQLDLQRLGVTYRATTLAAAIPEIRDRLTMLCEE